MKLKIMLILYAMKYDINLLTDFCNKNKIEIIGNYDKIIRDTIINFKCIDCKKNYQKIFRQLILSNGHCKECNITHRLIKVKQTCLNKFGTEFATQNQEIRKKIKKTCLEKYECENPFQIKEVKNKINQIFLEKFGCENPFQNENIKNKIKQTLLKKYGVEHPSQNSEIQEKTLKNSYRKKHYIFPSGKIILYQGYENFALNKLINEHFDENDIRIGTSMVPEIWYNNNEKKHRYFTDIFIPSQNKCIEVKSKYTFNKNKNIVMLKHQACKNAGYLSEIWIYKKNGEMIECIY